MSILRITGGEHLRGNVWVHGAKNSVLPIMAASLLSGSETVIHNCPSLSDVEAAMKILRHLGCKAEKTGDTVFIDSSTMTRCDIPDKLMREMRSSVIFLGAILARAGEAVLSMPGGCELGPRPIDLHLAAMRAMGAEIDESGGNLVCRGKKLSGCRIDLAIPSVGATENSMIAAAGCEGCTTITNAAREPEIRDLENFLKELGVNVTGAGTSIITIEGGGRLKSAEHEVIPDRIVAATFLASAAASGGKIDILGIIPEDIASITDVFSGMGMKLKIGADFISADATERIKASKPVVTRPYPGFPTDAQPPLMAASLMAEGTTVFVETIFENRYRHVPELLRMGADIRIDGRVAMVSGVKSLHGASVAATDLRGGAAMVVAALAAEGTTEISELKHIDRGYDGLAESLRMLGADAERID
ncbi:MAG: UDP-N-acetylglucosamine 1-carboxyvinyltransferase [Oscillospiraceae bacterium]